jgi:hypothetical protein
MSRAAGLVVVVLVAAAGSVVVASLAFVEVLPDWGLLFFYALPSLFIGPWATRELIPARWRRVAAPLRRSWRSTPLGAVVPVPLVPADRPAPAARPRRVRARLPRSRALDALQTAARVWLSAIRLVLAMLRSRNGRRLSTAAVAAGAAALVALVVHELVKTGWPAKTLDPTAAAAATALLMATFTLRALGWQRLFRPSERPRSLVLAMSNGAAAVASLALPSRIDDAITVGIVRRLSTRPRAIGTIALSLFVLGLIDVAALIPFSAYAAVTTPGGADRAVMCVLVGVGVGAAGVATILPSVQGSARLAGTGVGHWVARHAPVSRRDTLWAWVLVAASWLTQCAALLILINALGLHGSFSAATAYVVAGAAASTLPIGPAGAATEAGAGAAVLHGAGVSTAQAIALAVTAQALMTAAGAALAAFGELVAWRGRVRRRRA